MSYVEAYRGTSCNCKAEIHYWGAAVTELVVSSAC
jgi:hypothetical protein